MADGPAGRIGRLVSKGLRREDDDDVRILRQSGRRQGIKKCSASLRFSKASEHYHLFILGLPGCKGGYIQTRICNRTKESTPATKAIGQTIPEFVWGSWRSVIASAKSVLDAVSNTVVVNDVASANDGGPTGVNGLMASFTRKTKVILIKIPRNSLQRAIYRVL
ncbi:unnamed protein product [Angiostrongylus costaricensis]|uniref:BRCT domain-containing protein n=1 Tax=Angiostrongylus costaricensis TaxID=334426 RepID=A0A0R3PUK4_ANGCS|nr:unnamed protein product [Angiostrongylus costaricensis]